VGQIISRPDGPLSGFAKGAGAAFVFVGIPLVGRTLVMGMHSHELLKALKVGGTITAVICVLAGCGLAVWRLIQAWAYNQIENDPYQR
jgi:hypothetical protein